MIDQREEIKNKIDIVEFVNQFVPLKKAGQNWRGLCPFHAEDTPSFFVSPERQVWHCFGACNTGGDIFGFLMRIENLEFPEALKALAKRAGVELQDYRPTEGERQKQSLFEINHLASEFYHYLLVSHPSGKRALEYTLGRGISKDSIAKFKIGFSPNMWDGLQKYLVGKKKYKIADIEKAGLIITNNRGGFYDRFRNRLMFPLKDHRGNICGFAGRVLDKDVKEAKYINSPETLLYHKSELLYGISETKEAIKKQDAVVLVEGELDAISSYQAGVQNVVAIKGSALTTDQVKLLARFTKNIIFALDADAAGMQAARRGVEVAEQVSLVMKAIAIAGGKDPDEVAQKNPELWQKLVAEATPIYDFFINAALVRFNPKTAEGKRKIAGEVIPLLVKITDNIVQAHYIKVLAESLDVSEEVVLEQLTKFEQGATKVRPQIIVSDEGTKPTRRELLEAYLMAMCLQSKNWPVLKKRGIKALIQSSRYQKMITALEEYLSQYKTFDSKRLAKLLPTEIVPAFDRLYLLEFGELLEDEDEFAKEYEKTVEHLRMVVLKERMNEVSAKITAMEKKELDASEEEALNKLDGEFRDLSLRLAKIE